MVHHGWEVKNDRSRILLSAAHVGNPMINDVCYMSMIEFARHTDTNYERERDRDGREQLPFFIHVFRDARGVSIICSCIAIRISDMRLLAARMDKRRRKERHVAREGIS